MNRFLPFLGLMPITLLLFLVSFAEAIPGVGRVHHGQHHGHEHIRRAVDKSTKFVVQTVHTTVWVALATSSDVIGSTPLVSSEAPVVLLSSTSADGSVFPKPFGTITAAAEPDEIDVPPSMDANAILGSQLDSVNAAQAQTASEEIESDLDGAEEPTIGPSGSSESDLPLSSSGSQSALATEESAGSSISLAVQAAIPTTSSTSARAGIRFPFSTPFDWFDVERSWSLTTSVVSSARDARRFPFSTPSDWFDVERSWSLTASAVSSAVSSADSGEMTIVPHPPIRFASGSSVIAPNVRSSELNGISENAPTSRYVKVRHPARPKLPDALLKVGVNGALSTDYDLANDTGVLAIDETTEPMLSDLKATPHLSRDGGKGGYLNGQKLFIFCDTGSYTMPQSGDEGSFLGFVSSSVAVDKDMKGAAGDPIVLEDGVGQWSDDVGRMRGLFPLTEGEQSYNLAMQDNGQRYAIWAESSIIPYNHTHALVYAPIVYNNVNRATGTTVFTYTGTTLAMLTASSESGPRAERIVDKLFQQDEVEWGTMAGMRSYGPSGFGGNDGRVYVVGSLDGGLLLGRVDAQRIRERDAYEYWDGSVWSSNMQDSSSEAYFLPGNYMDGDLIYSPAHLTFIFVYLTPWVDNTFYFRYLKADRAIRPWQVSDAEPWEDFAENLARYSWSEEQVLLKVNGVPNGQYIYAGGVHQGYFDEDDLANGGKKLLLSWTVPTGEKPGAMASEYSHVTAQVELE